MATSNTAFNEQAFEHKLVTLKDTQEAINAMSQWCLQNKEHHKKIVSCWLHCLKRVKIEVRLSLFYLANDVIQYSKRKHLEFVDSWATALQKATTLVRDDKVRQKIQRIFKIWEERGVYDEAFISDLCGLLMTTVKKKAAPVVEHVADPNDFQPNSLVRKIKEIKVLGENTDIKYKRIKDNKLPLTNAESMRLSLKDRRHGSDVVQEVDNGVKKMEAFVKALESEIGCREKLLELLRQATIFYENQRGEAKIVANAYRNFGNRLKSRQKTLADVIANLNSPLPSPDVNAPSPSPDSDVEDGAQSAPTVPTQPNVNGDLQFNLVNSSFIGSADFLGLTKEVFCTDTSQPPPSQQSSEPQAIEVIGARDGSSNGGGGSAAGFDVAEFFKSLMPTKESSLPPPPMPPVSIPSIFTEWSASGPWDQPPPDTPQSPPQYEKQVTHQPPVEYDDSTPVPPAADVDHRMLLTPELPVITSMPPSDMDHRAAMSMPSMDVPPPLPAQHVTTDIDHRTGMPIQNMGVPPPLQHGNTDMDHRSGMPLQSMGVPPPMMLERGALIAPPAPPPMNLLGPPPLPPAVQAILDIDQRNLISLTGSPGSRQEQDYPPPHDPYRKDETSYPPPHNPYAKEEQENNLTAVQTNYTPHGFPPAPPEDDNYCEVDEEYTPQQQHNFSHKQNKYGGHGEYIPQQHHKDNSYEQEEQEKYVPQQRHEQQEQYSSRQINLEQQTWNVTEPVNDNVESIDMDCSDEDQEDAHNPRPGSDAGHHGFGPRQHDLHVRSGFIPPRPPFRQPFQPSGTPQKLSINERLTAMSSAGAKLIPPDPSPADNSEFYEDGFTEEYEEYQEEYHEDYLEEAIAVPMPAPPRPRWRPPRGAMRGGRGGGARALRPRFPYGPRGPRPRFFQPRCPW